MEDWFVGFCAGMGVASLLALPNLLGAKKRLLAAIAGVIRSGNWSIVDPAGRVVDAASLTKAVDAELAMHRARVQPLFLIAGAAAVAVGLAAFLAMRG